MKATMKLVDDLNRLWALLGDDPAYSCLLEAAKIVALADRVMALQQRFYAGEKDLLGECKAAERELRRALHPPAPVQPDLFGGPK